MDFGELLHTAKKNESSKPQIQYYPAKFAPPKKEQRAKTVSVNVQKFLARKEAEEKQKQREAAELRNKLLALRSQDKKATRRVNVMLKRTKSANQSAIADALDNDNTSVTLVGPSQPDEDDYGYVSQESSAFYNKMMEKYSKIPEEPKFPGARKKVSTDLSNTKDRVRAALEREKEEALLPHRRKRKHADPEDTTKNIDEKSNEEIETEKKEPSKPKFKPAPLVNFSDLLKLAEKKQYEPVVIEPKKEEEERPLTKKQKKEMEREREWRERKESQSKQPQEKVASSTRIPKVNESMPPPPPPKLLKKPSENIDRRNNSNINGTKMEQFEAKTLDKNSNITKTIKPPNISNLINKNPSSSLQINRKGDSVKTTLNGNRSISSTYNANQPREVKGTSVYSPVAHTKAPASNEKPKVPSIKDLQRKLSGTDNKGKQPSTQNSISPKQNNIRAKQPPPNEPKFKQVPPKQLSVNNIKPKQFPPPDLKPKQFPPPDLKPKQFPPPDLKPKQFPPPNIRRHPKDVKRKAMLNRRRIIDDDEEEYDPEMDDFIDDGPEDQEDYSQYISEIFGYDKRRYRCDDDDVDNMESTFAQQMKEEVFSAKIGIMEDLEDMRQEEEAKKRKLLMKKGKRL